jgi:hypothetical protein
MRVAVLDLGAQIMNGWCLEMGREAGWRPDVKRNPEPDNGLEKCAHVSLRHSQRRAKRRAARIARDDKQKARRDIRRAFRSHA